MINNTHSCIFPSDGGHVGEGGHVLERVAMLEGGHGSHVGKCPGTLSVDAHPSRWPPWCHHVTWA